jgi:hypothetical protein
MNWLRRFMMGRYGNDQLNVALMIFALVILVLGQILRFSPLVWVAMAILVLCYIRMFSRNTSRRYQENMKFMKFWSPIRNWFLGVRMRSRDKAHRYYKCPKCKLRVRVPKGKGKIKITCPSCKTSFIKKT